MPQPPDTRAVLGRIERGDEGAVGELVTLLYRELHAIAERSLLQERANHTLQPTALVHEAYLRLVDQRNTDWQSRAHFLAIAAQTIRRVLVDHARRVGAQKRGAAQERVPLSDVTGELGEPGLDLLALDEALEQLSALSERQRRVVELRFFGGLEVEDIAHVLGVSKTTVKEDWRVARAWLRLRLRGDERL